LPVLHGDLTRKIIDCGHKIFVDIGFGYVEKVYQKAFEVEFERMDIPYKRESFSKIMYDGEVVGKYFLDFLVDNKVALELKVRREMYQSDQIQLLNYLKATNTKVGLLGVIMKRGILFKRLMN